MNNCPICNQPIQEQEHLFGSTKICISCSVRQCFCCGRWHSGSGTFCSDMCFDNELNFIRAREERNQKLQGQGRA